MNLWTIWIITASTAIFAMVNAKDDTWPQKNPLKFLKAVIEQPTMCESGDYESCENSIFTNKGRVQNDVYEYNSEEINIEKIIGEIVPIEDKRSPSRAGCDCQLSTSYIDLGPKFFPRHIKNVTCDEHKKCYHSRGKGLHCLPIHYDVNVIKMQNPRMNPSVSDHDKYMSDYKLPALLRCCWRAEIIPTIVGCICGRNQ